MAHEHRPASYRSGGKVEVRCASCFELLKNVDEGEPAAPAPKPVEVDNNDQPPRAPAPEPVDGPEDHTRAKR